MHKVKLVLEESKHEAFKTLSVVTRLSRFYKVTVFLSGRTQGCLQCCCPYLLDVLFDLSRDEWVVDDRQHHGRVMAGEPATDQQAAVGPVTALREEDLQHHDFTAALMI